LERSDRDREDKGLLLSWITTRERTRVMRLYGMAKTLSTESKDSARSKTKANPTVLLPFTKTSMVTDETPAELQRSTCDFGVVGGSTLGMTMTE
jgi:hypothetical protein